LAGYGGTNIDVFGTPKFVDPEMNAYGERLALEQFRNANDPTVARLTQSYTTSDIDLKNSAMFGAKVGYFFTDEKLPWLGLELEAFTNKPSIKAQSAAFEQNIEYIPTNVPNPCTGLPNPTCPLSVTNRGTLPLSESDMRLITVAFNVVARYPGTTFQPYVGVGAGAFYFNSSGQIDGRQVVPGLNTQAGLKVLATEEWGLFVEGKYNYASIDNLDPSGYGLSGTYSAFNAIAGVAYHF
jgi:opacity protein-like surface antigen